jgi:hypothetical protein
MSEPTCTWCPEPSVCEIEVQPTQTRVRRMVDPQTGERVSVTEVTQLAIKVPACHVHRDAPMGQPPPVRTPSRTKAKDVPQLSIFDVPGVAPGSAILGEVS